MNGVIDPKANPLSTGPLTSEEEAWVASLLSLGSAIGPFFFGWLADVVGRRTTLLWCALPMYLHYVAEAFSDKPWHLYVARFIGGFASGCVFTVVPMYMGEVSDAKVRGAIGCTLTLSVTVGCIFSYVFGSILTVRWFSLACSVPSLIFTTLTKIFVPETPYFLVATGQRKRAEKALKELRGVPENEDDPFFDYEMDQIEYGVEQAYRQKGSVKDILKTVALRRGLRITCGLMFCQQFSGVNVVFAYMESVFIATGTSIPSNISSIIVGVIQTCACVCTSLSVDKLGRRFLLLTSAIGTTFSQFFIGLYFLLKSHSSPEVVKKFAWLPILSLCAFIIFYNLGFGPVGWTMVGELFPTNMRSAAATLTAFTCLFLCFFTTFMFPYMSKYMGMTLSFWSFSLCNALAVLFVYVYVIETKRKTLVQIQRMLNEQSSARTIFRRREGNN